MHGCVWRKKKKTQQRNGPALGCAAPHSIIERPNSQTREMCMCVVCVFFLFLLSSQAMEYASRSQSKACDSNQMRGSAVAGSPASLQMLQILQVDTNVSSCSRVVPSRRYPAAPCFSRGIWQTDKSTTKADLATRFVTQFNNAVRGFGGFAKIVQRCFFRLLCFSFFLILSFVQFCRIYFVSTNEPGTTRPINKYG